MLKDLNNYACIYIGGGNTYKLLSLLKSSGAFEKIRNYLISDNGIVDLGYINKQLIISTESSMTLSPTIY